MSKYPFNEAEELKDVGVYPAVPGPYGMPAFPKRRFNTPITAMENFQRIKEGKKPLWMLNMPTDFNVIQPDVMPDAYARNHGGIDWFGIDWQYEPLTAAAMVRPGTRRLSDITKWKEELVWPDLKAIDWAADYEKNYAPVISKDRPTLFVIVNGFFERLADLTSFADTFCYLLEEPEAAHEIGVMMNYHSCGCVGNQIENFIEAGFDYWEGQDACNDKLAIMKKYGDQLGQVSIFMPSPELSDEEFAQTVEKQVREMGEKGKYIIWFGDMKPGRSVNGEEIIYKVSRQMYENEA